MYEFIFGFVAGALTSRYFVTRKEHQDAQVQADELVVRSSQPIPIPMRRKKIFVPGELANIWSKS